MSEQTLKERLRAIRENSFAVPEEISAFELASEMLTYIGTPDSELRDQLIYATFVRWIEVSPVFTPQQLRHILFTALDDEHLWHGIDEPQSDAVFTRSFSVLLVPLILIYHHDNPFLSHSEIVEVKTQLLRYLAAEQDLRGFVLGKGWAHAVAHTADTLNELALSNELGQEVLLEILDAVRAKVATSSVVYIHEEEERLGEIFDSILSREVLSEAEWETWLVGFVPLSQQPEPDGYYQRVNIKNFLQSLYFRCHSNELPDFASRLISQNLLTILHIAL